MAGKACRKSLLAARTFRKIFSDLIRRGDPRRTHGASNPCKSPIRIFGQRWHAACNADTEQDIATLKVRCTVSEVPRRLVSFKVTDICIPEPHEVLAELHASEVLQGQLIDVTRDSDGKRMFAIVEVAGMSRHVIVALDSIQRDS